MGAAAEDVRRAMNECPECSLALGCARLERMFMKHGMEIEGEMERWDRVFQTGQANEWGETARGDI